MRLNDESLSRWLPSERRARMEEYVRYMRTSSFSFWTLKADVQAVLTLGLDGEPY